MAQEWKTINQEHKMHMADDWEAKSTKGKKGSSEGKMKIRNNEEIESKNEIVEMRNSFQCWKRMMKYRQVNKKKE
jgi:hypothetical protein